MQIAEIPPFVKKAHQQSTMSLVSHIPSNQFQQPRHSDASTKILEIPPYDPSQPKRSKDWTPLPIDVEHHLTIGPSGGAEWIKKLKANEPVTLHKSTECIVAKEQTTESDPEINVRPVPSMLNLVKPEELASTSAPAGATAATTPKALTEEEKAAEIAAKKSRLKQKLVKSARSVAIFSLKLKERRAREAERLAQETADVLTAPAGCGELDAIPIEMLLQVSDVMSARNQQHQQQQGSGI
uniref:CSON005625 protein n=3 Tax=Culicoides sonorensis TaxID=179676 RepID=A0A336M7A5_CULSO